MKSKKPTYEVHDYVLFENSEGITTSGFVESIKKVDGTWETTVVLLNTEIRTTLESTKFTKVYTV